MAENSYVTCTVCHQKFRKDKEEYIQISPRRYAHKSCLSVEDKVIADIHNRMKKICGPTYSYKKIQNQINAYLKNGKTVIGILKTIEYWYDILDGDPNKSNGGIGIVEYVYGDALDYWYQKEQNKQLNSNINIDEKREEVVITPTPIKKPKRFKLFDIR